MTIASVIVTDALRESNLIGLGEQGDAAQGEEGLRLLSRLVVSVLGNEVGEKLSDWVFPQTYPFVAMSDWVPPNTRIVMGAGAGSRSFSLDPRPQNGQRLQLIDAGSGFVSNPVTLVLAAAMLGGSTSDFVANTNGFDRTWMYRADLADWVQVSPIAAEDEFPFPERHDDAFIGMLAARLNPRYQQALSDESKASLTRSISQLRADYAMTIRTPADLAVLNLSGSGNRWGADLLR